MAFIPLFSDPELLFGSSFSEVSLHGACRHDGQNASFLALAIGETSHSVLGAYDHCCG